jgi:hypothetical protein
VYTLTNLNIDNELIEFDFDQHGSSHSFRYNLTSKNIIQCGHIGHLDFDTTSDQLIVLIPEKTNMLDYFDNQFCKQENKQIVSYIRALFSDSEIQEKLASNWNFFKNFNENVPRWILREWSSFWIQMCLEESYGKEKYQQIPAVCQVGVSLLFKDLYVALNLIADSLSLTLSVTNDYVQKLQDDFVKHQSLHGMQEKCQKWVNIAIQTQDNAASPCVTIFDEAYVQYLLRESGYELQCDGLEIFPKNTLELNKIMYKND